MALPKGSNPKDPDSGKEFLSVDNTYMATAQTGTTSGADFIYSITTIDGYYEIVNTADATTSSPMSWPNSPSYTLPTTVNLTLQATVVWETVNAASGYGASAKPGHWTFTPSNAQGGYDISGNVYTVSGGEIYTPVTTTPQTATQATYLLTNGQQIAGQGMITTGQQQYSIMAGPGPWPAGIGANTSATIAGAMLPVFADLGIILKSAGISGMQSIATNWIPNPDPIS